MVRETLERCDLQGNDYLFLMSAQNFDLAPRIAVVDLKSYTESLKAVLAKALDRARCSEYSKDDDAWARDPVERIEGPPLAAFAALCEESKAAPLHDDRMLLLVARTVAALGRASDGIDRTGIELCASYEGQGMPLRLGRSRHSS
jgi:hypothetical protein